MEDDSVFKEDFKSSLEWFYASYKGFLKSIWWQKSYIFPHYL